jgi:hypothetical protein
MAQDSMKFVVVGAAAAAGLLLIVVVLGETQGGHCTSDNFNMQ